MDITAFELDQAQILLAHKQADTSKRIAASLAELPDCDVRLTITDNVKDTARELDSARFDLVLCDRRLLTVKLIEEFNRLRSRGEAATTVLLSNEPDDKVRHTGRAIGALDAIPLSVVTDEALSRYVHIALRLGTLSRHDNQAGQVLNAVGTFGDVFFYRARIDEEGEIIMDWLSRSFEEVTGYPGSDFLDLEGGLRSILLEEDIQRTDEWLTNIRNNHRAICEHRIQDKMGRERWIETKGQPIWSTEEQRVVGVIGRVRDINQRRSLESKSNSLEYHQGRIAELGQMCSQSAKSSDVIRQAPKLVAQTLACDICGIFERKGNKYVLAGSYGWKLNAPADRFISADAPNELAYAIERDDAVIIESISGEERFTPSHIVFSNGAQSGLCIPIKSGGYEAVLCVYHKSHFSPSYDELRFIYTLADFTASIMVSDKRAAAAVPAPTTNTVAEKASAISLSVQDACQQLLGESKWQQRMETVLQTVGDAYDASHALLFDIDTNESGNNQLNLRYEWAQPGQSPHSNNPDSRQFVFSSLKLSRIEEPLQQGEIVVAHKNKNSALQEHFNARHVALVPILIEESWWGCLCLLGQEKTFKQAQLNELSLLGLALSTAIQRQRIQKRMSAVIEGTASTSGEAFLNSLAQHLAKALQTDHCHIASLDTVNNSANVLSNWNTDRLDASFEHDISLSPCARLLEGDLVYYAEDAALLFPGDTWLGENGIQGFLGVPIKGHDAIPLGYITVMHSKAMDVGENDLRIVRLFAERAAAEFERERMSKENRMLSAIPQETPSPIISCDLKGRVQYFNPAAEQACQELNLVHPQDLLPKHHLKQITQVLKNANKTLSEEYTVNERTFEWFYHAHPLQGRIQLYATDITQRRREEDQIRKDAFHDQLTGLPNRGFFKSLLSHAIEKAEKSETYQYAVLFIDLDRFKVINDSLGHSIGDSFLEQIASRLVDNVRPGDYVARFGGDEFAILLDGIKDEHDASDLAIKIQREIQKPINLGEHETFTSASIGIALSKRGYRHVEDIIRDADSAMYHAKNNGKAQHSVFSTEMYEHAVNLLELESDLRRSIEQNELKIHYQPIVDIAQDKLVGFEALVRWQHPKRGLLYPDDFIPLAEETGFVRELDRWMLNQATDQLQDWQSSIPEASAMHLSLNLSGSHFDNMEILSHIGHLLTSKDLSGHLKLELTESVLMQNSSRAIEMFNILHARGLGISIDDFGVGYSSLTRLKRLPIGTLKIDRSFVQHMEDDQASLDIIRAIIDLAYNLKMEVVAEGVETAKQYKLLKRLGCHYAQGFYLAKGLPAEEAADFIKAPLALSA